jgi:hypothetical protein
MDETAHPSKRKGRVLQILDGALGATGEDDAVAALVRKRSSGPIDLLLRGDAVRYLAQAGGADRLRQAVAALFYVAEEAAARGIPRERLGGGEPIAQDAIPQLLGRYDQVWHF